MYQTKWHFICMCSIDFYCCVWASIWPSVQLDTCACPAFSIIPCLEHTRELIHMLRLKEGSLSTNLAWSILPLTVWSYRHCMLTVRILIHRVSAWGWNPEIFDVFKVVEDCSGFLACIIDCCACWCTAIPLETAIQYLFCRQLNVRSSLSNPTRTQDMVQRTCTLMMENLEWASTLKN